MTTVRRDRGFRFPKDAYADELALYENFRYLENYLDYIRKRDLHAPTVIIAASDTTDYLRAHFRCDGTNDQDVIEEAIDTLPSTGGHIHFLEGSYDLVDPVTNLTAAGNYLLSGSGRVLFDCDGEAFTTANGTGKKVFTGLTFTGSAAGAIIIQLGDTGIGYGAMSNCRFETFTAKACISGSHLLISGNDFVSGTIQGGSGTTPNGAIWADRNTDKHVSIVGNRFDVLDVNNTANGNVANFGGTGIENIVISGNVFRSITGTMPNALWMAHNIVDGTMDMGTHSGVDHGGLAGLTDDDHTQYLKEKASGGAAAEVPEHDHSAAAEGSKTAFEELADAAGDIWYASAADTGARLALGTAGQFLKVNAGATAPEWGTGSVADLDDLTDVVITTPADNELLAYDSGSGTWINQTPAEVSSFPLGTLGYAQVTADQTGITAEADLTNLTVTVTAGTSRRIRITGHILISETDGTAGQAEMRIKESTTQINTALETINANGWLTHVAIAVITPSAGSHTYKLTLAASTTVSMRAAGNSASGASSCFILVEDIGPA